jgi:hypothetical protein
MNLRRLRARIEHLEARIPVFIPAWSLTTDEEIQARAAELGSKCWGGERATEAEEREIDYLKQHFPQYVPKDPLWRSILAWERVAAGLPVR